LIIHTNIKVVLELKCALQNFEREMIHYFHFKNVVLQGKDDLKEFWKKQEDFIYSMM
jgi:hypothetical protein